MSDKPADKIYAALHARYPPPKWVLIPEAPSTNSGGRRCDALAVGVWGSSGRRIIGHEVKVSRSDWLRELQQPEKADAFCDYCDCWFLVAPPGVVKLEELRATWGLLELSGNSLKVRRQPEKIEAKPIPRDMMAAWLRRVSEGSIEHEVRRRVEAEKCNWQFQQERSGNAVERDFERLRESVAEFESKSGITITRWDAGNVGAAVKTLMQMPSIGGLVSAFQAAAERHERLAKRASEAAEELAAITDSKQDAA